MDLPPNRTWQAKANYVMYICKLSVAPFETGLHLGDLLPTSALLDQQFQGLPSTWKQLSIRQKGEIAACLQILFSSYSGGAHARNILSPPRPSPLSSGENISSTIFFARSQLFTNSPSPVKKLCTCTSSLLAGTQISEMDGYMSGCMYGSIKEWMKLKPQFFPRFYQVNG